MTTFCKSCGLLLQDGQQNCPECGASRTYSAAGQGAKNATMPIDASKTKQQDGSQGNIIAKMKGKSKKAKATAEASADTVVLQDAQSQSAQQPPSKKRRNLPLIIVSICAAVVIIVLVAILCLTMFLGNSNTVRELDTPKQTQEAVPESSKPTIVSELDLNDPEDYKAINMCLSNFSEIGSMMDGYSANSPLKGQKFLFAFGHAFLNSTTSVEYGNWNIGGTTYIYRVSFDKLSYYCELFLKEPFTVSDIPSDIYAVTLSGNEVYVNADGISEQGIALATGIEPLGNDLYRIRFDIFGGFNVSNIDSQGYTVTNEELYTMTPEEAMARFGQQFETGTGVAIIQTGYDNKTAPFKVMEYQQALF